MAPPIRAPMNWETTYIMHTTRLILLSLTTSNAIVTRGLQWPPVRGPIRHIQTKYTAVMNIFWVGFGRYGWNGGIGGKNWLVIAAYVSIQVPIASKMNILSTLCKARFLNRPWMISWFYQILHQGVVAKLSKVNS